MATTGEPCLLEAFHKFELTDAARSIYVHFSNERVTRSIVAFDNHHSLVLMSWGPGHKSAMMCHKSGVEESVRILEGHLLRDIYTADGKLRNTAVYEPGKTILNSVESGTLHRTRSRAYGTCVSLHLFTPCVIDYSGVDGSTIPLIHCPLICGDVVPTARSATPIAPCYINFLQLVELLRLEIQPVEPGCYHSAEHIKHIKELLEAVAFNPKEWIQYSRFMKDRYTRNMVGFDEKFTVLILSWEKGQISPIHNHGGSSCWVKVLEGEIQEELFVEDENGVHLTATNIIGAGGVAYINDSRGLHTMGNPRADSRTVSLHIYAPAYNECFVYDRANGSKRTVSMAAVNKDSLFDDKGSKAMLQEECAKAREDVTRAASLDGTCCDAGSVDGVPLPMNFNSVDSVENANSQGEVGELSRLVQSLCEIFERYKVPPEEVIQEVFRKISFNRQDWDRFVHFGGVRYTRNLLAVEDKFSLLLNCWGPDQGTPIHDHGQQTGRRAWVQALEGEVVVTHYEYPPLWTKNDHGSLLVTKQETISGNTCRQYDDSLQIHKMHNQSATNPAVTLHLYSPPYIKCCYKGRDNYGEFDGAVPVVYCQSMVKAAGGAGGSGGFGSRQSSTNSLVDLTTESTGSHQGSSQGFPSAVAPSPLAILTPIFTTQMAVGDSFFGNMHTYVSCLRMMFATCEKLCPVKIANILRGIELLPSEYQQYGSATHTYSSALVAFDPRFCVFIKCWKRGQASPILNNGNTATWTKVLDGSLTRYDYKEEDGGAKPSLTMLTTLEAGCVGFVSPDTLFKHENIGSGVAYTLHIHSPPITERVEIAPNGEARIVFM